MSSESFGFYSCIKGLNHTFCIELYITELIAFVLLLLLIYQIYLRIYFTKKLKNSKFILMILMTCSVVGCLFFNCDTVFIDAYFFENFFQYIFLNYLVYYLGRKAVKDETQSIKSTLIIAYYWVINMLLTLSLIYNFCKRYLTTNYELCNQAVFAYVRVVGFFLDLVFLLFALLLNNQIKRQLSENYRLQKLILNKQEPLRDYDYQRKKMLFLVIIIFITWFLYSAQDIYFIVEIVKNPNFMCNYISEYSPKCVWSTLNLIIRICGYFLPFYATVYLFWYRMDKQEYQENIEIQSLSEKGFYKGLMMKNKFTSKSSDQISSYFKNSSKEKSQQTDQSNHIKNSSKEKSQKTDQSNQNHINSA